MTRSRVRTLSAVIAALSVLGACSSDEASAPPSASAVASVPAATATSPVPDPTVPDTTPETATTPATSVVTTTTAAPVVQPPAVESPCRPDDPADYVCYTATVPLDPADPSGATIDLAVTTRRVDPATWTSPVLSLCTCALGAYVPSSPPAATYFVGHDIVWVDARGAGRSDGVTDCPAISEMPGEIATTNFSDGAAASLQQCMAATADSKVPLASILDHDVAAADLIAVRKALGIDRWTLNAGMAGADIEIRLANLDAEATTALVVRSPEVVGIGVDANTMAAAWDHYVADCAASSTCSVNGDLDAALATVLEPPSIATSVSDPNGASILLDPLSLRLTIAATLPLPVYAANLPALLAQGTGAADAAAQAIVSDTNPTLSIGELAARCQDVDYIAPGLVDTADDHGGVWVGTSHRRLCDILGPVPQFPPLPDVTSDVPTLVIVPAYDSRSSIDQAKQIFAGFTNATIVEVPYSSDPSVQLDCYNPLRTGFIEQPTAPLDTSCLTNPAVKTFP